MGRSFFTLAAQLSLQKICKNLETWLTYSRHLEANDPTFFADGGTVYKYKQKTRGFRKRDANRTPSPSYSIPKIAHNLFLYPWCKICIWNWALNCKFTRKMESKFPPMLLFISITFTLTRTTSQGNIISIHYNIASKFVLSNSIARACFTFLYKIIQIVRALWLAIKPFYMSVCKHGFHIESSRGVFPAIYLAVTQFL